MELCLLHGAVPKPTMAPPTEMKKDSTHEVIEKIGTGAPNNQHGLRKSSRSRHGKSGKVSGIRRGIKPMGENGVIWQGKFDMKRMFEEKKIMWRAVPKPITATHTESIKTQLQGTVPQEATATPTEMIKMRLLGRDVPTTTTATPTEMKSKKIIRGAVPQPPTATPTEGGKKQVLLRAVPKPTTATPARKVTRFESEIVLPTRPKPESLQLPTCNRRIQPKITEVKMPGELKSNDNEVIVPRSMTSMMKGTTQPIKKSTKGATFPTTVSEIRKIWENKNFKSEIRPGSSANKPICVEPMGGQIMPTVLCRPTAPKE